MELEKKHNLSGRVFGKWTVSNDHKTDGRNRLWWCTCACGYAKWVKAMYLKAGTSRQCVSCGSAPQDYTDVIPSVSWTRIVNNASKRHIPITITRDQAADLLVLQGYRCALSGCRIAMRKNGTVVEDRNATASLDRIDSKLGYVEGNVQWVHKRLNMMKGTMSQDEFILMCKLVVKHHS